MISPSLPATSGHPACAGDDQHVHQNTLDSLKDPRALALTLAGLLVSDALHDHRGDHFQRRQHQPPSVQSTMYINAWLMRSRAIVLRP